MDTPKRGLDLTKLRVRPLAERRSLSQLEQILIDPDASPPPCPAGAAAVIRDCAHAIKAARSIGATVLLMYGAHLVKNGLGAVVNRLISRGWVTHLATNGAGAIHDWELAFFGRTEESVRENIASGTFGAWDETGRFIHIALLVGGLRREGFGAALGRFIAEDGTELPNPSELREKLERAPADAAAPAIAELLHAMQKHQLAHGRLTVLHRSKHGSVLATAFEHGVNLTVHPGIGYDIISCHPMFNGAAIGRAAQTDFELLAGAIDRLDGGVVLAVGSAVMAPQVFEKAISCVNNLRVQQAREVVRNHAIYVVDIQDAGGWDWSRGEPPKTSPAYYLRFCKSFARAGGSMRYVQCDNVVFLHNLLSQLERG
ncbi:MAG: hypothetical protein NZ739_07695 [Verrucomicrobiae bacterium]|nr:hypothetical protein [Verrucomicrobiae bacterium]